MIAAYVSGHGFGHSTRVGEVLARLRQLAPELPLAVVTSAPGALYRAAVPGLLTVRSVACDIGLVQRDALVIDEEGTVAAWRAFAERAPALVEAEAAWLRWAGVRLVLADIPPLAFDAARRAGVPAVGMTNFSWDWIYRHLGRRHAGLLEAAEDCARSYSGAELLLQLPFAGDLSAFATREPIPLVARRPSVAREEARKRLGLGGGPHVLLSFGGIGMPGFDPGALAPLSGYTFLTNGEWGGSAANVIGVDAARLDAARLDYADLVGAADVVVTKPGYGIVTDAIGAGIRMVYTDRGDFPEYPVMVAEMGQYLACTYATNDEIRSGRLASALEDVLAKPQPVRPDISGADVAAKRLLSLLGAM
jgi:hypothetical protein